MIQVACAILIDSSGKLLISKRSLKKKEYPGLWELPGGKFNNKESIRECIIREIKEELGIDVEYDQWIYSINHLNNTYDVNYCICHVNEKQVRINSEIDEYKFITLKDYVNYSMMPNDKRVLSYYLYKKNR